jgi:pilus assembly protein Flp/PilA
MRLSQFPKARAVASSVHGRRKLMRKTVQLMKRLGQDEEGAALVEYTVLLGIMLVAVITTIGLVGGWMTTKWTALWSALSAN